jgi:hypothetical protein
MIFGMEMGNPSILAFHPSLLQIPAAEYVDAGNALNKNLQDRI